MKKVSVIIPVYKTYDYLRKCFDSLINQTLKDIEIIIVNDGSPDNSEEIIKEYSKKYPKLIKYFYQENAGQGSARNTGMKYAEGEYISFVDSDDYLDLNALEEMYNLAKKNNSDIVICDMVDEYPDKKVYHNCTKYDRVFNVTGSACNKIFKKEVLKDIEFLSRLWYEDFNFTTKILLNTDKISTISKGFYICSCGHESTMNNNNSNKNLDIITVMDDLIEYAKENNLYDEDLFNYLIFDHILITSINRVSNQKNKDKKKVIKELLKYCKKNINHYSKYPFYKKVTLNRKIIAKLNYLGLSNLSKIILQIKKGRK